jgi:Mn-containing catalase
MFSHHKELAYTVRVDKPNPVFARMLQQAIGGPEGEMRVMNQYLFQGLGTRGPERYRDMLLSTATEEIGHIEILCTAVAMNLEGAPAAAADDVVTNPLVAARMGAMEPRHLLSAGMGAMPSDANGVPFNAACIDIAGNLGANMMANAAAEGVGRALAARLRDLTDDPGMKDMLSFLIARDSMHQMQWLAAAEELNPEHKAIPIEVADEGEYAKYSHAFFAHHDEPVPEDATWTGGTAPDGGTFTTAQPAPVLGSKPSLQGAPPYAYAGPESTMPADQAPSEGVMGKVKDAVDQVTK